MKLKFLLIATISFFYINSFAQPRMGQKSPDIKLNDQTGQSISLYDSLVNKGKVVLIDFWASWCGPCRRNNPKLVKLYKKYKDKGFEILGISIDGSSMAWKAAIKKDKLSWTQVISQGDWNSPMVSKWNLQGIPTAYLLNKAGEVVAIDLEGKALENAIKKELGI
jgi:thiol-disulfide isomerase/thioredoxin